MLTNRPPYGLGHTAYAGLVSAGAPDLPDEYHTYRVSFARHSDSVVRVEVRQAAKHSGTVLLGWSEVAFTAGEELDATVQAASEAHAEAFAEVK
jgi:hypothetical protein